MSSSPSNNQSETILPEPLVILRENHPVSRKYIDREALKVMHRLRDAGFTAFLVGGGVRDIYLGKIPKDFDISTNARPGQIRKIFRNSRVIGRRFRLVQVFFGPGKLIEVSTFRRSSEYDIGGEEKVLPSNNSFGNPAEDAFRRDLTINAIFYDIENYSVIDYTGGVLDLKNKVVRIVGDPDRRITRDPVRMMRAIRHAARSSFEIEHATWEAICRHSEKLSLCPVSRVRDELFKDLTGGACSSWAALALDTGIFFIIFPFYKNALGEGDTGGSNRTQLLEMLAVIDRQTGDGKLVPDDLLLSLLLIPWAFCEMDLLQVKNHKESYHISRKIREALNETFSYLNIKKSMQDSIARCLATLPLLITFEQKNSWPKWLAKKSYFENGRQLFRMYREASGGPSVSVEQFSSKPAPKPEKPKKTFSRGGSRGAAFAWNTKGGVFGFREGK